MDIPEDPYLAKRSEKPAPMKKSTDLSLQRFLAYDRVTLRFFAVWDDRSSLFGDVRRFIFYFFLADDTLEICEELPENSGRGRAKTFLKRQKVPFGSGHLHDTDLMVGCTVKVYGREFLLHDADSFTKRYYEERYGVSHWPVVDTGVPTTSQEVGTRRARKTD